MNDMADWAKSRLTWVRTMACAHSEQATHFNSGHYRLGIVTTIASAIVGTAVFSSLAAPEQSKVGIQIGAGLLSVLATVLVGLQTFFGWLDTAARHKIAAVKFQAINRKIELFLLELNSQPSPKREDALKGLERISGLLEEIDNSRPIIQKRVLESPEVRKCLEQFRQDTPNQLLQLTRPATSVPTNL